LKLTPQLAQALTNLRVNADFKLFLSALKEDEETETDTALKTEGTQCARAQGAVLKLRQLQEQFMNAPNTLERFKINPPK
jgi:hypothetical protein